MIRGRRGAAAVEFALWMPILLVLFAGVVDLSRYMSSQQGLTRAARDGARYGITVVKSPTGTTQATPAQIEAEGEKQALYVLEESGMPCTTGCTINGTVFVTASGRRMLTVAVSRPFTPLMGMIPQIAGDQTASFTMMTQLQP